MKTLSPGYFGMVMATGIVSIAALDLHLSALAIALFVINAVTYVVVVVLTALRAVRYWAEFAADLSSHRTGTGFFTTVAASCILGVQLLLIAHDARAATALLFIGFVLWFAVTYTVFTAFTIGREKPLLQEGITGSWLLAVVATQSVAVLGALIARHWAQPYRLELDFSALAMWSCGGTLYVWIISLMFYRYVFFALTASDLAPTTWITMGAMAISALAGSLLVQNAADAPFLASLAPFVKGLTVSYWATGMWWIPMLLTLGVWRYVIQRVPLRYDVLYWGAVFPLGMYSVATTEMASALQLLFLGFLPHVMFAAALAAWAVAFAGLLFELRRVVPLKGR